MPRSVGALKRIYSLNCSISKNASDDWSFADASDAGLLDITKAIPKEVDLRGSWWPVDDQGKSGACVGYATAYGLLRWLYVKKGLMKKQDSKSNKPSARFIWMANKETDELTNYPTTFIEGAGTQTKLALKIARKYGCVTEDLLPMSGKLSKMNGAAFYTLASQFRILSYHNLGHDLNNWRRWLATQGPILTRLEVDDTWYQASQSHGQLVDYDPSSTRGGHAVCLVGYSQSGFIVRNSWGVDWGDGGFAYAAHKYASVAFTEAYGAVI